MTAVRRGPTDTAEGHDMRGDGVVDEALVRACAGDPDAFAVLYRDTAPRLLRYAIVLVGQDAEDVAAEAWLQIARDLRGFRGELDGFRGWAATVVRHRAVDLMRAAARRPVVPVELDALLERPADDAADSTADAVAENLSTADALALVAGLPRDQAEAVLLRAVVGLDVATAAAVLGKRPGAVRVAAHRGLKRLARDLSSRDAAPHERAVRGQGVTG